VLPAGIQLRVNLDSITFIGNDPLESVIARTTAMPEQKAEAVGVSTEAWLRAPRIGLLIMAGLALVTILPAGRGPG
jgi:hypothetical protein